MREQISELERRRCEAIAGRATTVLNEIHADEYVHVHGNGKVDGKAGFIAGIVHRPRRIERGELTVRLYGEVAVITGEQINLMLDTDGLTTARTVNIVTQVARREGGQWRYISFHLTAVSS